MHTMQFFFVELDDVRSLQQMLHQFRRIRERTEVQIVECERVIQNEAGEVVELICSHDPASLDSSKEQRKVKGVIHWVSRAHGIPCEVRNYDRLFAQCHSYPPSNHALRVTPSPSQHLASYSGRDNLRTSH